LRSPGFWIEKIAPGSTGNQYSIIIINQRGINLFPNKKVQKIVGSKIQVEMKGDLNLLEGTLKSVDDYMNLHLVDTMEIVKGEKVRSLGSVVLRGNNIILITPVED
jgi:U6 snRNA-associated Sm-like protein LSm5